ncbi:MAG: hypothetical protein ACJAS9_003440, partial [Polaribacter sp.]
SGRNDLVAFTRHILQKAQISKFKTKESEHTHYFITLGV